jgi:hypothetical protein
VPIDADGLQQGIPIKQHTTTTQHISKTGSQQALTFYHADQQSMWDLTLQLQMEVHVNKCQDWCPKAKIATHQKHILCCWLLHISQHAPKAVAPSPRPLLSAAPWLKHPRAHWAKALRKPEEEDILS